MDAFKDRKFTGVVTEIANSSKDAGHAAAASQDATKFEVRIRIKEKEAFRPGMSVTAEIETRYRTNVLTVPIASVTTRLPKEKEKKTDAEAGRRERPAGTNSAKAGTNSLAANQRGGQLRTQYSGSRRHERRQADKKSKEAVQADGRGVRGGGRPRQNGAGEDRHQRRQLLGDHRRA